MRILMVMPFFPYPPTDGGRIGFFNPIKYMSRSHEVAVVTLATEEDATRVNELRKLCSRVDILVPKQQNRARVGLRSVFGAPPGSSAKYWLPEFGELIRTTANNFHPDIVEFHHLNTAAYENCVRGVPRVLREHNIEYKVWERHGLHSQRPIERLYVRLCSPRVRKFEAKMASRFDKCITVSPADAEFLREISPLANTESIPSGVDTEYFRPVHDIPEEALSLVFTGSFAWKPKQHNLRILLKELYPRIAVQLPEAKLYVVGKGIPSQIANEYRNHPRVILTGEVPDVRPFLARASLVLNYLESGGGIALKVLEAMAMQKPVLSNTLGCEGIQGQHGRDVFLADGQEEFAKAAVHLLRNRDLRDSIAMHGTDLIKREYSWHVISKRFSACYAELLENFPLAQDVVPRPAASS